MSGRSDVLTGSALALSLGTDEQTILSFASQSKVTPKKPAKRKASSIDGRLFICIQSENKLADTPVAFATAAALTPPRSAISMRILWGKTSGALDLFFFMPAESSGCRPVKC